MTETPLRRSRRAYYHANKAAFKAAAQRYETNNRPAINARHRAYLDANPKVALLCAARSRAKKQGVPFNLVYDDLEIPTHCPVLGIKLIRRDPNAAPSIDRRVPALGYVKGNITIMSLRANKLKNDGTPAELHAIVAWLDRA
jgi:hypothetical protein